jgi:hypothetical protein
MQRFLMILPLAGTSSCNLGADAGFKSEFTAGLFGPPFV